MPDGDGAEPVGARRRAPRRRSATARGATGRGRRRCGAPRRRSPSHGSSGETGASLPRTSSTPSSCSQRSAKQRSVRSGQKLSVRSRSSSRCAGCTLARTPSRAIVARVLAADQLGVLDRAAWRRSPRTPLSACVRPRRRRWRGSPPRARAGWRACISVAQPLAGDVRRAGATAARRTATQHHAVRVFSDPSEMIFSGPIVTSGPQPGSGSPVRSPGGQEVVERVDVRPDADAQQLGAAGLALGPGAGRSGRTRGRRGR